MENTAYRAIAIVGAGAVLPDAPNVPAFWENVKSGRYSISEVSPDRWDPARYYDADHAAPDKTYSKIGGWVREHQWEPVKWHLAIPPRVVDAMDGAQKWAIASTREALEDYGYPQRHLNLDRTAVILGNAMAGERHYFTALRAYFPEYAHELAASATFGALPEDARRDITQELHQRMDRRLPEITEDSMPGELANCIPGRIANIFNFHGPNYVVDAACASALAAISAAVEGLVANDYDVAVTGGIDRNMGASTFIKFCKIGALSGTGTRPYAEGADGFVMGEGAVILLLKRLADAERDGDKIYAVLRGIGGSSDGKGKGITAPNPVGQKLSIQRAWQNAGLSPATATLIEGHGTSTQVGDVVEVESMAEVLSSFHLPNGSVALGSVKSNIGHLKGAAGAAGLLKTALALRDKVLPPNAQFEHPNPDIDFAHCPLYVNGELKPWTVPADGVRRAGVSSFGFGGTNFHAVLEEYIPHRLNGNGKPSKAVSSDVGQDGILRPVDNPPGAGRNPALDNSGLSYSAKAPLRGALVVGGPSEDALVNRLRAVQQAAERGQAPVAAAPAEADLGAPERVAIDYADATDLADKSAKAVKALLTKQAGAWKALRAQGIFRGHGPAPKVAFVYPGQGSQYVNMLRPLCAAEPIVAQTFAEADGVAKPLIGKPITEFIFVDRNDAGAMAQAEEGLRQTAITQPAVLTADIALTRLFAAYGIQPDMTMGHSLGEYGALVASGALPFEDALEAVSARGREMTRVSMEDNGRMAAVTAPLPEIERILKTVTGYVVIANINSNHQAVIGGGTEPVAQAMELFQKAGYDAVALSVSHAFHTSIVAPASDPMRRLIGRLHVKPPSVPIVANVTGDFYPTGPGVVPQVVDLLARQVASPVQFVRGLHTLYGAGARLFVEMGPKKALQGFVDDVLGEHGDVVSLFTNHPKTGDIAAFNQALCGLYAAGLGQSAKTGRQDNEVPKQQPAKDEGPSHKAEHEPVVITGAALGLPGKGHIFDDENVARILRGDQFIDLIPTRLRQDMLDKHITRLVKSEEGGPTFETITSTREVIRLAGRGGVFDLESEFGVSADRLAALDQVTRLAMAAGIDALRDAGIPLVLRYKTTSKGTELPDRWGLPDALRDDTGVIFASAFPGCDSLVDEVSRYHEDHARREQLAMLESLHARLAEADGHSTLAVEVERRMGELRSAIERAPYVFDRRFLFRVLSMGHSQFAEFIGARGPNTQINAACASTTQGVALAEDWIRAGRCRRAIVISADDITSDHLMGWFGAGFLASGAAATDDVVEDAATPFDRRRHGMLIGMGAAAMVVESAQAARERGIQPICEVLSAVTANSAFHGTRLNVDHIGQVMENLVAQAEARSGIARHEVAPRMVFVSHETYTPARGGSAAAEIYALRHVFGETADRIVIANTKGLTGHAMGTGIEDVVAVKALETGLVPPVANFKEVDPDLGVLNLSKGGAYPIEYALRLGAGFGSQISMTLLHWVKGKDGVRPGPNALGYAYRVADKAAWETWLSRIGGNADLEVVHRTLRVRDTKRAANTQRPRQAEIVPQAKAVPPAPIVRKPEVVRQLEVVRQPEVVRHEKPAPVPVAGDRVKDRVLALVAEKTGYPPDMLDLDLDLEADLGIDTVKQAEVFASIREAYGITRDDKIKLRDYPTLAHVIRFVQERPGAPASAVAPAAPVTPAPATAEPIKEKVLAIVAEKTGYPQDMLDLDLDLEADLGIDTVKQAEMFASIREAYGIARDDKIKLRDYPTLAHVIRFVQERSGAPVTAVAAAPAPATAEPIKEKVLEIVAEKTGYPQDMLDLDLDLEADLGIDTVKQAEMFASIREAYGITRDDKIKLRDYPTLAHVIRFVQERSAKAAPVAAAAVPSPPVAAVAAPAARVAAVPSPPIAAATAPSPPVAAVAAPAPPVTEAPIKEPITEDAIKEKVLQIVAEKTGYPTDMLDLDLDLEADLGIDTVKQAEMFASVRAAFNIPRQENVKLRDFPTLAHVIQFACDRSAARAIPPPAPEDSRRQDRQPLLAIPHRVPVPLMRPALTLCKPTGVTLGPGSRVAIMPDRGGVSGALAKRLRTLGVEVLTIEDGLPTGTVQGVYWLPAIDSEGSLTGMDLVAWREALEVRVKSLHTTMRHLYEQIAAPGTFLISATRLGGQHGYDEAGAAAPLGGAVTGFTKTYKRERLDALVKAVDFEAACKPEDAAELLVEETLRDPGAVEIGYRSGLRWTVGLADLAAASGQPGLHLGKDTVFVITGAAGSIVSAITADLAAASGGTFYLLDLAPEPDPRNPDLGRFMTDREGLKRDLFARIQARGERATPALVEKELAALERAQAAQSAIDAVRRAGGTAQYFSVNLTDAEGVATVIQRVRERSGRIDVLLHAAGIERSRLLPDKDPREFNLIFDVKADGWFHLLHAIGDMPLAATVAFSSIAGRFGNPGQTDYSAANDLLCKIASSMRTSRPSTRAIAIDWTAWGGIGMASRGSIPKTMEQAGIDMLPPEVGIPVIRRELTEGAVRGEIVIAQRLGVLGSEWDAAGGLQTGVSVEGPMIGKMAGMGIHSGLTVETVLDPAIQPFLHDHQIGGTPLLPGVMGIEAFAETALSVLPGWQIEAIEDVNFLAPFKFYRNEPRTAAMHAVFSPHGEGLAAECQLTGSRSLPNQAEPQITTHFTARVLLAKRKQAATKAPGPGRPDGAAIAAADIYRVYFHGPAYQVMERAWWDGKRMVGEMARNLPANHHPPGQPLAMAPRLIELCLQTAGLCEIAVQGQSQMSLPRHIQQVCVWDAPDPAGGPFYAVVTPAADQAGFDADVVDAAGNRYVHLSGYRTVALPGAVDTEPLKALQLVMA